MLEAGHAVLADFGVAHAVAEAKDERLTRTGTSLGTPAYMSPEQATGEQDLDGRSDQYALGCVLYEMLAGHPPFTGAQLESVLTQHLTAEPPDITQYRPRVPVGVREALSRALAKSPADRFRSTAEFGKALVAELHTPSGGIAAARRPGSRIGWGVGFVGVAALALVAFLRWNPPDERLTDATRSGPAPWTILAEVEGTAPEETRGLVGRLLANEIDATRIVQTLPDDAVRRGLAAALKPDTTRLTPAVARELAERGRLGLVFAPELDQVGGTYLLSVKVQFAPGDSLLATSSVTAAEDDALIPAAREIVDSLMPALVSVGGGRGKAAGRRPAGHPIFGGVSFDRCRRFRRRRALRRIHRVAPEGPRDRSRVRRGLEANRVGILEHGSSRLGCLCISASSQVSRAAFGIPTRRSEARLAGDQVAEFRVRERQYRDTGAAHQSIRCGTRGFHGPLRGGSRRLRTDGCRFGVRDIECFPVELGILPAGPRPGRRGQDRRRGSERNPPTTFP